MKNILYEIIPSSSSVLIKGKGFVPVFKLPVTLYSGGRIKLSWGLQWFYFKQIFNNKANWFQKQCVTSMCRLQWFYHLKLELITLIFLPYILLHNFKYVKHSNIRYVDYCIDDD